jgi:hypothetical protein
MNVSDYLVVLAMPAATVKPGQTIDLENTWLTIYYSDRGGFKSEGNFELNEKPQQM